MFFFLFLGFLFSGIAQKNNINYDQAFKNTSTNMYKPLPGFIKWADDNQLVFSEKNAASSTTTKYVYNIKTNKTELFIDTTISTPAVNIKGPSEAINTTLSPNKKMVAYTNKNNLFIGNTEVDGKVVNQKQLTFDGNDSILNGFASWIYYEEILGRASRYKAFWWSNDSKHIVFMHFDDSEVPVFPIYVSKGQQGFLEKQRYPKAGNKNPKVKIGIVAVETGKITWADFNENEDQYFGMPFFTTNNQVWIQWMNRGQDKLKIFNIDLNSGAKNLIYNEEQTTWIDLDDNDRIEFLQSKNQFILKSDKSGWYQYYLHDLSGKLIHPITQGAFTVGNLIKIDEQGNKIYFTARKKNSARWDVYSVGLDGKNMTRLSFGNFSFSNVQLSPNNKYFVANYGNLETPLSMGIVDVKGNIIQQLGSVKGEMFTQFNLPEKKMLRVKSTDGLFDLPFIITYPINFNPQKKYPILMSVYGGPNAGRVYDNWGTSPTDIWWAQEELIQISADNRSSGHFGKIGMNFIHKKMGIFEIEDFMAIGKWVKEQPWADTSKLCITGGSFGGYMSCMALTYGANVFNYGVANSSVTDWQLYDTHYTERYMDTPEENPLGYKQTSVMNYVDKYKGLLRIVHGTSDDNVHEQNSLQLVNKLQDSKKHFELMFYPGERHGISGAKGLHNRTEAYQFYYNKLLNKSMPTFFWQ